MYEQKYVNYFSNFLYVNITAKTIIIAAVPWLPRLLSKAIKFFVTCEPKKATFGPKTISAITETANNRTAISKNLFK